MFFPYFFHSDNPAVNSATNRPIISSADFAFGELGPSTRQSPLSERLLATRVFLAKSDASQNSPQPRPRPPSADPGGAAKWDCAQEHQGGIRDVARYRGFPEHDGI